MSELLMPALLIGLLVFIAAIAILWTVFYD
jgi:hypothetical protein